MFTVNKIKNYLHIYRLRNNFCQHFIIILKVIKVIKSVKIIVIYKFLLLLYLILQIFFLIP